MDPGLAQPPGGKVRWTDETIEVALRSLLVGRDAWPTRNEFERAGLRGLGEVLRERDEAAMWAARMGVSPPRQLVKPVKPRPATPVARSPDTSRTWPKWTEATITTALTKFLAGRDEWPKYVEFIEAGYQGLYHAVRTHGGARRWAQRMDVRWVDRNRRHRPWTEDEVRSELRSFLRDRVSWPTEREFDEAGKRDLLRAAGRLGGTRRWRRELSIPAAASTDATQGSTTRARELRSSGDVGGFGLPAQLVWTDERIEAAIRPLIERLGHWPTKGEFAHAGQRRALSAVYDHGGSASWQRRLGVEAKNAPGPVPDRTRWTDPGIEAALRALIAEVGRWPTEREFSEHGPVGLYSAAVRHGGVRKWRNSLMDRPPDFDTG